MKKLKRCLAMLMVIFVVFLNLGAIFAEVTPSEPESLAEKSKEATEEPAAKEMEETTEEPAAKEMEETTEEPATKEAEEVTAEAPQGVEKQSGEVQSEMDSTLPSTEEETRSKVMETGVETPSEPEGSETSIMQAGSGGGGKASTGTMKVIKVDAADPSKRLPGAVFEIIKEDNKETIAERTTDANGEFVQELPPGRYIITETKAPEGYALTYKESQQWDITSGSSDERVLTNQRAGGISIFKTDKYNSPLAGGVFEIKNNSTKESFIRTTDSKGQILETGLAPGSYTLREVKAPEGYIVGPITERTIEVSSGDPYIIGFINEVDTSAIAPGTLEIINTDIDDNTPLAGAVFEITNEGTSERFERTTDANGEIVEDLAPGPYSFKQIKAPEGYADNPDNVGINIESGITYPYPWQNKRELHAPGTLPGTLKIVKIDEDDHSKRLPGAVFEIKNATTYEVIFETTDTNGEINLTLDPGKYILREIKAPEGYSHTWFGERSVDVFAGETTESEWTNEVGTSTTLPGKIKIIKVDENDHSKRLPGAVFEIKHKDSGAFFTMTTDANGEILTNWLRAGYYVVTEIKAPLGYVYPESAGEVVFLGPDKTAELTVMNKLDEAESGDPKPGRLRLIKVDEEIKHRRLSGAVFEIKNEKTNEVITRTTNLEGEILVHLAPGSYRVTEIKPPSGYLIGSVDHLLIDIVSEETTQKIWTNRMDVSGSEGRGRIKIIKFDWIDRAKLLAGAVFEIKNMTTDEVITLTTDANGEILTDWLDPAEYEVTEIKAPPGYELPQSVTQKAFVISGSHIYFLEYHNFPENKMDIVVEKVWVGGAAEYADFHLFADGKFYDSIRITADTDWKATFKDCPKLNLSTRKTIQYTLEEISISGYESSISTTPEGGFIVVNTKKESDPTLSDTDPGKDKAKLPATGSESRMSLLFLGLIFGTLGWYFLRRRAVAK